MCKVGFVTWAFGGRAYGRNWTPKVTIPGGDFIRLWKTPVAVKNDLKVVAD